MDSVPPSDLRTPQRSQSEQRPGTPPGKTPSRTRRAVWFLVVLVLVVLLLGGFFGMEQFKQKMIAAYFAGNVPPPTPVATALATTEDVPQYLEAIGTMMAVHQVTISPEVEGRILAIKFESGDAVTKGALLVQQDDATERADLATFQAQARLALVNLARAKQLASKEFGSRQEVDQQQSLLDQANAGIAKSQANIDYKAIKAPFDGVLGIRQVNLGQYLAAGAAVVTLTDLDNLYVDFTLPEQERAKVSDGQKVEFHVDAYPDRAFAAEILTIDPQVDPSMRALQIRAKLPNPDHALQPGMYGRIDVILPPRPNVVTVPETAIDYTVYGDSVFLVRSSEHAAMLGKPPYKIEQVFVTLGQRVGDKVSILKGIQAGDRVVVGGQLKLHTGATVSLSDDKSLVNPGQLPVE
ncbi:MAG TPA: efflux RND transporter periplasmic adaptor subunit [Candidatus Cybelea sp.]|nr:efflux RND transporter periplasmic adaptor subunit [Candidatus Cybelea sp.]